MILIAPLEDYRLDGEAMPPAGSEEFRRAAADAAGHALAAVEPLACDVVVSYLGYVVAVARRGADGEAHVTRFDLLARF